MSAVDWDAITQREPFFIDAAAVGARVAGQVVAVTGAAGSLGGPLSEALAAARPRRLLLLDQHEGSLFELRQSLAARHPYLAQDGVLHAVLGNVGAARRIRRVFMDERPTLVFHLAAYKHVPWGEEDPEAFVETNVLGARSVIDAAREAGTAHIVYPSTDKAIDPPSLYGATKRLVETMLYAAAGAGGPRCSVIRFVNVLGSRGSAPETFGRQLADGRPLSVTDRAMRRYWITPDHARLLLLHAACLEERAITVTPDAGDEITVLEIARRMALALFPEENKSAITVTGLRPGERLYEPIVAAHERLEALPLPGILAVRGGTSPDPRQVAQAVTRLDQLLHDGAAAVLLRSAIFEEVRSLQSLA